MPKGILIEFLREPIGHGAGGFFAKLTVGNGNHNFVAGEFKPIGKRKMDRTQRETNPTGKSTQPPRGFVSNSRIVAALERYEIPSGAELGTMGLILHPDGKKMKGSFTAQVLTHPVSEKEGVETGLMNSGAFEIVEQRLIAVTRKNVPSLSSISYLPSYIPPWYRHRLLTRGYRQPPRGIPLDTFMKQSSTFIRKDIKEHFPRRPPSTSSSRRVQRSSPRVHQKPSRTTPRRARR